MIKQAGSIHRFLDRNVFPNFPEDAAMALGKKAFSMLPLKAFRPEYDGRLRTSIAGIEMDNPLVLPACYSEVGFLTNACYLYGAVTYKTTTPEERFGNPLPHVLRYGDGFLNSVGLKNPGIDKVCDIIPHIKTNGTPIIGSIGGRSIEEYGTLASKISNTNVTAVEANISCPNTENRMPNEDPRLVGEITAEVMRKVSPKPVIVKISPDYNDRNLEVARNAIEAGARVINCGNTKTTSDERFYRKKGGMSGPELKRYSIPMARKIREEFPDVDMIITGGITTGEDALEALEIAQAVGVLSAFAKDISRPVRICEYLVEHEWSGVRGI